MTGIASFVRKMFTKVVANFCKLLYVFGAFILRYFILHVSRDKRPLLDHFHFRFSHVTAAILSKEY